MFKNKEDFAVNDNWLEEQRELESRISAWDFDDAKKLAQEHSFRHSKREAINYKATGVNEDRKGLGIFFALNAILFSVLIILVAFSDVSYFYAALTVLMIGLFPGMIIYSVYTRKFPPNTYWIILFILTLILTIVGFIFSIFSMFRRF